MASGFGAAKTEICTPDPSPNRVRHAGGLPMVRTASTMSPLGTPRRISRCRNVRPTVSLGDFADAPALLVMFICNHCPYVKHVAPALAHARPGVPGAGRGGGRDQLERLAQLPRRLAGKDGRRSPQRGYTFPYLFDETQEVAKAYRAACTPDFFLFDATAGSFTAARWTPAGRATHPGDGRGPARRARRRAGRPAGRERAAAEPRLQHQVEARQRAGVFQSAWRHWVAGVKKG